jgi:hypothetical protein
MDGGESIETCTGASQAWCSRFPIRGPESRKGEEEKKEISRVGKGEEGETVEVARGWGEGGKGKRWREGEVRKRGFQWLTGCTGDEQ